MWLKKNEYAYIYCVEMVKAHDWYVLIALDSDGIAN